MKLTLCPCSQGERQRGMYPLITYTRRLDSRALFQKLDLGCCFTRKLGSNPQKWRKASLLAMATNPTNEETGSTVSPPVRVKRERSDEEETGRRVSQRTEDAPTSIAGLVKDLKSADEEVLEASIHKLVNLLYDEDDRETKKRQKLFYQVGGQAKVVDLMNEHADCYAIQKYGISVLRNATYKNQELKVAVAVANGIQAILAAMKKFPSERDIQRYGLRVLFYITTSGSSRKANTLVTKVNDVPFIISQMDHFSDDAAITEWACKLLNNLTLHSHLIDHIRGTKAMIALATACHNHKGVNEIQKYARKVQRRLVNS